MEKIDIATHSKIVELFQTKGWEIDEDNKKSLYNRYLTTLKSLKSEDEKEIFLTLSNDYRIIDEKDYTNMLIEILLEVFTDQSKETVYVYPIELNKSKTKSGKFLSYLFKSIRLNYMDILHKKEFIVLEEHTDLIKKNLEGKRLLIIDDYVGSGKQCIRCFDEVFKSIVKSNKYRFDKIKEVNIISLVANIKGKEYIEERISKYDNVSFETALVTGNVSSEYHDMLMKIGIADKDGSFLGYEDTADLITMVRTPNNTLPIFRKKASSPFRRR